MQVLVSSTTQTQVQKTEANNDKIFESSLRLVMLLCVGLLSVKNLSQKAILVWQTPYGSHALWYC